MRGTLDLTPITVVGCLPNAHFPADLRYGHLSSLHKVEAPVQLLHKPRQPRRISGVPACQQHKVGKHRLPMTCRRVNLRRLAEQSRLPLIEGKCHLHERTGCAAQLTTHLHGYTVARSHIRKQLPQDVAVPIDLRVDSVKTLRRCALLRACNKTSCCITSARTVPHDHTKGNASLSLIAPTLPSAASACHSECHSKYRRHTESVHDVVFLNLPRKRCKKSGIAPNGTIPDFVCFQPMISANAVTSKVCKFQAAL